MGLVLGYLFLERPLHQKCPEKVMWPSGGAASTQREELYLGTASCESVWLKCIGRARGQSAEWGASYQRRKRRTADLGLWLAYAKWRIILSRCLTACLCNLRLRGPSRPEARMRPLSISLHQADTARRGARTGSAQKQEAFSSAESVPELPVTSPNGRESPGVRRLQGRCLHLHTVITVSPVMAPLNRRY